jgi:hypothetical protein
MNDYKRYVIYEKYIYGLKGLYVFSPKGFDTMAGGETPGKECTHTFLSPEGAKENGVLYRPFRA